MNRLLNLLFIILVLETPFMGQAQVPDALGSEVPPLQTSDEAAVNNMLTFGLTAGSTYDDNALNNNANKHSDVQYDLQPFIKFTEQMRRLGWSFEYQPGAQLNQHFANQRFFSQRGAGDLSYQFSKRLTFSLHGGSGISSNPFDRLNQTTSQLGPLDRPNLSIVLPRVKQISEEASLGLDYKMSAHTFLGVNGNFSDLRYRNLLGRSSGPNLGGSNKLIDTRIAHGRLFLGHEVSRLQTLGASYTVQDLSFPHGHSATRTHGLILFDEIKLSPSMNLTFYAGPEYSQIHDQIVVNFLFFQVTIPVSRTMWSPQAGADFNWQRSHTAFRAGIARRVTDGGGLTGAVQAFNGAVQFRQDFSRRWKADVSGRFETNHALGFGSVAHYRTYTGEVGLTRILTRDISMQLRYERARQGTGGTISGRSLADHNRVCLSLQYQWQHSLGR